MTTLYLAHPLDSRHYIREWELKFEKKTGISLLNPFYDTKRTDVEMIDAGRHTRYEKLDPGKIVTRDLKEIYDSDGLVAIVDGSKSFGTIMEIQYANIIGKPSFGIITTGDENHPWLSHYLNKIFTSLAKFERHMIYGQEKV